MAGLLQRSSSATSALLGEMGKLKQRNLNSISSSKTPKRCANLRFRSSNCGNRISAFFFNPVEDPVIKQALKEPVAFAGGLFAGILRLDLNEEPLKEWVKKTAESAGITEEVDTQGSVQEDGPIKIEIEIE